MEETQPEVLKGLTETEFWSAAARAARVISEEGFPSPSDWTDVETVFLRRFAIKLGQLETR